MTGNHVIPVTGFLSIWRKHLPTVNAAVRAHVRASLWCSQVAHPHFCNIVLTFKAVYRLYLLSNINVKILMKCQKNAVHRVLFFSEILALNCTYLTSNCGKMGHQSSHFQSHFQKRKTGFMFRRWPFSTTLKEFLKILISNTSMQVTVIT